MGLSLGLQLGLNTATGGVFTPVDLPSVVAWWTASRPSLITGSTVSAWADVKAGYQLVQAVGASRPTYNATAFNGRPSLIFDGIDDELTCTDTALMAALATGSAPSQILVVCSQDALFADGLFRLVVGHGSDTQNQSRRLGRAPTGGANRARSVVGNNSTVFVDTETSVELIGRHVIQSIITATTTTTKNDAAAGAGIAVVPSTTNLRLRVGASSVGAIAGGFWLGQVTDIVMITGNLSAGDQVKLEQWAQGRI